MSAVKTIALLLVVLGAFGIWLEWQGKLGSVVGAVLDGSTLSNKYSLSQIVVAIVALLIIVAFLPDSAAVSLVLLLALAAVITSPSVLGGGQKSGSASPANLLYS